VVRLGIIFFVLLSPFFLHLLSLHTAFPSPVYPFTCFLLPDRPERKAAGTTSGRHHLLSKFSEISYNLKIIAEIY
jgi:hypothetical protein